MSTKLDRVVGLFGTCGNSQWREQLIPSFQAAGVDFFNPVVDDWNEEAMKNEARHVASDQVIMVVITGETTAIASMAESGWIALEAVARDQRVVIFLEDMPEDQEPKSDERGHLFRPNKTRKLLRQHIAKAAEAYPNHIFLAASIEDAGKKAIELMETSPVS